MAPPVPLTWVWLNPMILPEDAQPFVSPWVVSGLSSTKPNGTAAPGTVPPPLSAPINGSAHCERDGPGSVVPCAHPEGCKGEKHRMRATVGQVIRLCIKHHSSNAAGVDRAFHEIEIA